MWNFSSFFLALFASLCANSIGSAFLQANGSAMYDDERMFILELTSSALLNITFGRGDLMADEVSNKLLSGLNRIGLAMRSAAWGDATESGLTPTQSQILAFIAARSAQNPRSGDAADALGITPQTASVAIAALVAKGLVNKVPDASDRRASALKLTRQGEVAARVAAQWPDFLTSAMQDLDQAERKLFLRILIKLIRRLQADGQIMPQRLCVTCAHFHPNAHPHDPAGAHHCNFIDAPLSDFDLRLDCSDHRAASAEVANSNWTAFLRADLNGKA
ncbi:MAG: MarR family winged helix-turn-helix transcriptional regulator [Dongiaceae bacterium]